MNGLIYEAATMSRGGWSDVSLGDISTSISNGCSTLANKVQSFCSWSVDAIQNIWSQYISPAFAHVASAVSKGFTASKDFVQTNPILTGIVAAVFVVGGTIGYLFGSRNSAARPL